MAYTTIDDPGLYFNTVLYTSNSGSSPRTISGVGFQPDWVWVKNRDSSDFNHVLANSVIGLNTFNNSDTTAAQLTNHAAGFISSANSDGFVVTAGSSNLSNYDTGSNKQVAWNWKAGTSFSNDASATSIGSIDSSGSVSTTSGFAIITYNSLRTGSTVQTFAHGLGATPDFLIFKNLTETQNWLVWSKDIPTNQHLNLNNTNTLLTDAGSLNNTAPTSTVITIGADARTNSTTDGKAHICYAFKEIKGYSRFSTYPGNGSTDGTFVYTGFKPAWILLKNTGSGNNWNIFDNKRNTFNVVTQAIAAQESGTGQNADFIDFLSNGFKLRSTDTDVNGSGKTYLYAAFAESPFVNSNGVPNNAR
jgi:hypothetical protein